MTQDAPLASRFIRLLAHILDALFFLVTFCLALFPRLIAVNLAQKGMLSMGIADRIANPVLSLGLYLLLLVFLIVQIFLLSTEGQTLGKKALHIRIVDVDSGEVKGFFSNFVLRLLVNGLLSIIPFYKLVDILFIFREDRRCIHDFIASTIVIQEGSATAISKEPSPSVQPKKPRPMGKFG